MSRRILVFVTGLLTVLGIAVAVYGGSREKEPYERVAPDEIWFTVSHGGVLDHIRAWKSPKDGYYVFLPSYATRSGLSFDKDNTRRLVMAGYVLTPRTDLSAIRFNRRYELLVNGKKTSIQFRKSAEAATLFLTAKTDAYLSVEDRDEEEEVLLSLMDKDGSRDLAGMRARIRGRGNSTWLVEKKPYRIEMDRETPLLGMEKAKHWLLLANAYDATNLKNKLVFDLAERLFQDWSPEGKFVDVYFNGEYRGLYLLAEKVEVDTGRVARDVECLVTQETIGRARSVGKQYAVEKWLAATGSKELSEEDVRFLGAENLEADDEEMTVHTEGVPDPVAGDGTAASDESAPEDGTAASDESAPEDGSAASDKSAPEDGTAASDESAPEDGTVVSDESAPEDGSGLAVPDTSVTQTRALPPVAPPYTGDRPLEEIAAQMPKGSIKVTKSGAVVNIDIVRNPALARETNRYITHRKLGVEIEHPKKLSDSEYERITDLVQAMENALFVGGDRWKKIIDKESWAKRYLMDEFSGNFDGDKLSSYFYAREKHGKIKFFAGPVWDYDKAFMQEEADGGPYLFSASAQWRRRNVWTPYYKRLLDKEAFRECVRQVYRKELRPMLVELRDERLARLRSRMHSAAENNELRWGIFMPPVGYRNQSGEQAMDALVQYINLKIALMDDKWISGHEYVTVAIEAQRGGKMLEYEVRKGNLFTQFPNAQYYGIINPSWYEMVTKKKYTAPFAPEKDMVLWLGRQE